MGPFLVRAGGPANSQSVQNQRVRQAAQSVFDLLEEGKRKDAAAVQMKYLLADVLNTWIRAVESERNELNVPYYSGLFERMNRCMTWDELKRCFEDIHGFLFRCRRLTAAVSNS